MRMRLVDPRNNEGEGGGRGMEFTVGIAVAFMLEEMAGQNKSPKTIKWYQQRLTLILSQWWDHPTLTLAHQDFRHLQKYVLEEFSPATANGYIRAIKRFLNWLEKNDYAHDLRARHLDKAVVDEHIPPHLTDDEVIALLGSFDTDDILQLRDKVLTMLLIDTGLRISEALNLTIEDMDGYEVKIDKAKSRVGRVVAMSPPMVSEMNEWIRIRKAMPDSGKHLFPSNVAEQMSGSRFYRALQRHAGIAGITTHVSAHVLRYTFAHNFLNAYKGDVAGLARALGHSSLTMAMHYARIHDAKAHEQSMEASVLNRVLRNGNEGIRKGQRR